MPWLIDAQTSYGKIEFDAEPVTYKDEEAFELTPQQQFPDIRSIELLNFARAEFEVGRRYWCIRNVKQPHRGLSDQITQHLLTSDGSLPDWLAANLDVLDGELPARLGESNIICDQFKCLLEKMEPGKHRFVKRDYRMSDHVTPWPVQYWKWLCCNYVDCIIPDIGDRDARRSLGFFWMMGDPKRLEGFRWPMDKGVFARIAHQSDNAPFAPLSSAPSPKECDFIPVLNRDTIANVHAWAERDLPPSWPETYLFLSDEIVNRMNEMNLLSGFFLRELNTSDLPATRDRGEGIYCG